MWFRGGARHPGVLLATSRGEDETLAFHELLRIQNGKRGGKRRRPRVNGVGVCPCQGVSVYVGRRRTAVLRTSGAPRGGVPLKEVLAALEPQVTKVLHMMSFSHADMAAAISDRVRLGDGSRESLVDSMKAFKSSPGQFTSHILIHLRLEMSMLLCQ